MKSFLAAILMIVMADCGVGARAASPCPDGFFLRDGDVYVIYGDSITDHSLYAQRIENYVLTRFPRWNVTFYNLGWGGDVARNVFRFKRDVLPLKPTAFTDAMGMNDGGYQPLNRDQIDVYVKAYRQTVPLLRNANPNVRIGLISPIPYEIQPPTGDRWMVLTRRCCGIFPRSKGKWRVNWVCVSWMPIPVTLNTWAWEK